MNYDDYDGLGLAQLVSEGKVSAAELLQEAIARLDKLNPMLNAVITPMYDGAHRRVAQPPTEAPFAGVPLVVKDLMLSFAGEPMSNGSRALRHYRPSQDCAQAQAIREAGFIVLGKTNCSELGAQPLTNPIAFGPTCNPWDPALNAGGSSGGSTAAVAARIVPLAASSDGGGSIRLPASYCGVFGFKPSGGLNPYDSTQAWGGAVVTHATTLTVRDSAAYLDWTSRRLAAKPQRPAPGSLLAQTLAPASRLRIGFTCESPVDGVVHRECYHAVENTAKLLESLGHTIELCSTPYEARDLMRALLTVVAVYTRKDLMRMGSWLGRDWRGLEVEDATRFMGEVGGGVSAEQLQQALEHWRRTAAHMERFHQRYDVLLTPTVATLPLPHDALSPSRSERLVMRALSQLRVGRFLYGNTLLDQAIEKGIAPLPFLQVANCTGQPAMSVPLHWSEAGLPVGSHFLAARGRDGLLFNLAAQLEQAAPWRQKRPAMAQ